VDGGRGWKPWAATKIFRRKWRLGLENPERFAKIRSRKQLCNGPLPDATANKQVAFQSGYGRSNFNLQSRMKIGNAVATQGTASLLFF